MRIPGTRRVPVLVLVVAVLAAGAGGAVAKDVVTGKDVKNGTLTGKDVKDHSLGLGDLKPATVTGLRGATGLQGPQGLQGPRGPGAQLLSYGHTLGYPAELTQTSDLLTAGPLTYSATCDYDVDDDEIRLTLDVRGTTAFTLSGTLVVRNNQSAVGGPFPVLESSAGAAVEVVNTSTIRGSADVQRHSASSMNLAYAGGVQELSFVTVVSPGNVCRLTGSVTTAS